MAREDEQARLRRSREIAARASEVAAASRVRDAAHRRNLQELRAHALAVLTGTVDPTRVRTSLPRGPRDSHQVLCGACGAVLATGYDTADIDVVLRCYRCQADNSGAVAVAR